MSKFDPIPSRELKEILDRHQGDKDVERLVNEILWQRTSSLNVRRECAEVAARVSPEAAARIRETAQEIEFENGGYRTAS